MVTSVPPPLDRIASRLDVDPEEIAFLGRFDALQLELLDTALGMAQHTEDLEVRRSMRDAVGFVPAVLRRRVIATLFPRDAPA